MTSWFALTLAGLFEIGFTTCMKLSDSFTQHIYTAGFILCAIFSFYFLSKSLATIPLGTAYAVWTGIGAFGTAIIGVVFFKDPSSTARMILLLVLISSILGLKFIAD